MSWVTDPTPLSIRSQVTELDSGNTPRTLDISARPTQRVGVSLTGRRSWTEASPDFHVGQPQEKSLAPPDAVTTLSPTPAGESASARAADCFPSRRLFSRVRSFRASKVAAEPAGWGESGPCN